MLFLSLFCFVIAGEKPFIKNRIYVEEAEPGNFDLHIEHHLSISGSIKFPDGHVSIGKPGYQDFLAIAQDVQVLAVHHPHWGNIPFSLNEEGIELELPWEYVAYSNLNLPDLFVVKLKGQVQANGSILQLSHSHEIKREFFSFRGKKTHLFIFPENYQILNAYTFVDIKRENGSTQITTTAIERGLFNFEIMPSHVTLQNDLLDGDVPLIRHLHYGVLDERALPTTYPPLTIEIMDMDEGAVMITYNLSLGKNPEKLPNVTGACDFMLGLEYGLDVLDPQLQAEEREFGPVSTKIMPSKVPVKMALGFQLAVLPPQQEHFYTFSIKARLLYHSEKDGVHSFRYASKIPPLWIFPSQWLIEEADNILVRTDHQQRKHVLMSDLYRKDVWQIAIRSR